MEHVVIKVYSQGFDVRNAFIVSKPMELILKVDSTLPVKDDLKKTSGGCMNIIRPKERSTAS